MIAQTQHIHFNVVLNPSAAIIAALIAIFGALASLLVAAVLAVHPAPARALELVVNPALSASHEDEHGVLEFDETATQARFAQGYLGLTDFYRASKGSNRTIDGTYRGYAYLTTNADTTFNIQLVAFNHVNVVFVDQAAVDALGLSLNQAYATELIDLLSALDSQHAQGLATLKADVPWVISTDEQITIDPQQTADPTKPGLIINVNQTIGAEHYLTITTSDQSDPTKVGLKPICMHRANLVEAQTVMKAADRSALANTWEFLRDIDYSPLWVTLKTTGTALAIIFVLGLGFAYGVMLLPRSWRSIIDSIITIPLVLPPTVCGFILLALCGRNTGFGRFFIEIGFPLIFSWQATVLAAVVVALPFMYRSALGAFESIDPLMIDAAKTLGWSRTKIFVRLLIPLSWHSITTGLILAFARALGEFGATLFLAGNYLGITRTIPLAIYFEWMNGNNEVAWFWTATVIVISFAIILFINLYNSRATRFQKGSKS